jgi:hypothetical protein
MAFRLHYAGYARDSHGTGQREVHGDTEGVATLRRSLSDWLTDMDLRPAAPAALLDRFIGYYEPYATSHEALDRDTAFQEEVRNVARAVAEGVRLLRTGAFPNADQSLQDPRPK